MNDIQHKTFNFYCDESCHLEHDNMPYMLIGYVSTAYNQLKLHNKHIRKIKKAHEFSGEVKWNNLSKSRFTLYKDLIDYFFATDLEYRAIVIDKSQIDNDGHDQSHDEFYYKMYFQLLHKKLTPHYSYNIYLDIKDTRSAQKVQGLKRYLSKNYINVRNVQNIKSHESELMQLADIITGALVYNLRGLNQVVAKNKIIERIKSHTKKPLTNSTLLNEKKLNLFFIDLH